MGCGAAQGRHGGKHGPASEIPKRLCVPSAAGSDPDCTEIPVRGSRDGKAYLWRPPPALQACLYDVDILLYPCLFAWTESDGSSVMGLFALMESSGSAINFMDRTVVSRQGIEWPEPVDWTPPDV